MRVRSRRAASVSRAQNASCAPGSAMSPMAMRVARRVEPDQVAHAHVGAERTQARRRRCPGCVGAAVVTGVGQADQRAAQLSAARRARSARRCPGLRAARRAPGRPSSVMTTLPSASSMRRAGPTGWQPCVTRETMPTASPNATPDRPPSNTPSAMVSVRVRAEARPAEQVAGRGAGAQLADQLGQLGRAGVGMHQRGVGLETIARQRRGAGEQPEVVARQVGQHQHQRRLVEVLDAAGADADADRADPADRRPALLRAARAAPRRGWQSGR